MVIYLSHDEALLRARQAGLLVASLYGRPDLVLGIRRAGVPVAIAFALGASAVRTHFVSCQADAGYTTALRSWIRLLLPRPLLNLGKSAFLRPMLRVAMAIRKNGSSTGLLIEELAELKTLLTTAAPQSVVVVDDAIDTGMTMRRLLQTVENLDTRHVVRSFALTSTLGVRIHDRQLHLFESIVEFVEGDLGRLDEKATAVILARHDPLFASQCLRPVRLQVALRDLLMRAPDDCMAAVLVRSLKAAGDGAAAIGLRSRRMLWRLTRPRSAVVMRTLRELFEKLPERHQTTFLETLAAQLWESVHPVLRPLIVHPDLKLRVQIETGDIPTATVRRALGHVEIVEVAALDSPRYRSEPHTGLRALLRAMSDAPPGGC